MSGVEGMGCEGRGGERYGSRWRKRWRRVGSVGTVGEGRVE